MHLQSIDPHCGLLLGARRQQRVCPCLAELAPTSCSSILQESAFGGPTTTWYSKRPQQPLLHVLIHT